MIVWLVAVPAVLLLLAFAGAKWKVFHLAYCKHLLRSSDPKARNRGFEKIMRTHLKGGMDIEEVQRLVAPLKLERIHSLYYYMRLRRRPATRLHPGGLPQEEIEKRVQAALQREEHVLDTGGHPSGMLYLLRFKKGKLVLPVMLQERDPQLLTIPPIAYDVDARVAAA